VYSVAQPHPQTHSEVFKGIKRTKFGIQVAIDRLSWSW